MNALYLKTNGDTVNTLAETLEIEGYGVSVIEIFGKVPLPSKYKNQPLFLCSDISQDTHVGNIKLPVLRMLKTNSNGIVNNSIYKLIWLEVVRRSISFIRLYICDINGEIISLGDKTLYCSLLLIPDREKC